MAMNIVSTIMQSILTPDMIARAASLLGINPGVAQKAIEAGIPAILGIFANRASTPEGAHQLSNALAQQPAAPSATAPGVPSSLLGSADTNALASAIGNVAGINTTAGKSLIGMLGPHVMSALGQQQRASGLDASGMANLLASQKNEIVAAMPSGLSKMLSGTNLLDNVHRTADAASAAAGRAASAGEDAIGRMGQVAHAAAPATSPQTWPFWVAGLAALAALGWFLLPHEQRPQLADGTTTTPSTQSGTVGSRTPITAADLTKDLTSSVSTARTALLGMTDPASARASLPQLQQATARIDKLSALAEQLPPSARQGIASSVKPTVGLLEQLFDKILASPELAAIAKPTIDILRSKLQALSQA
ncbi:MAG: DUF937 domain-containing protein [Rhizobiales bacterium]|nr:DUF937 domain-containing protein [Hyphomicrobiales bacterium]